MKYVLTNKQLFDSIYSYIDSSLNEDDTLTYSEGFDYDIDDYVSDLEWFYIEGEDDWVFEYIHPEYWNGKARKKHRPADWLKSKLEMSPILEFSQSFWFLDEMNNMFGDIWKPVFEQWFVDNFPELPAPKTYLY